MTRPNILFVFPDQWRGDWVGAASPELPLQTPHLDALIARGTGFRRAWTPSPLCVPARSCLATGKSYGRAPAPDNRQSNPIDVDNFYRRLSQAGYVVASFGKTDLFKPDRSWGKDGRHRIDGIDRLAQFGITQGCDMAGKHDSADAAEMGCSDPYTDHLEMAGLIDTYLGDLASRSGALPSTMASQEAGLVVITPQCYSNTAPSPLPPEYYADNFVGQASLDFLGEADATQRWFLMVNFPGPHEPVDVTSEMAASWDDVDFPLPYGRTNEDGDLQRDIRRRYAAMLNNIDTWLGKMVAELSRRDLLENTIIVFASDHGEMLGDRNLWEKQVPYEPSLRVPLVWAGPGIEARGLVDSLGSLIDIPVTLLAMAGAAQLDASDGHDLSSFLGGSASSPNQVLQSGLGEWRAVTDGRWKLALGYRTDQTQRTLQTGVFQTDMSTPGLLFDLDSDPRESVNLWNSHVTERERLREEIMANVRRA